MLLGFLAAQVVANGVSKDVNLGDLSHQVMSTTKFINPKLVVTTPFLSGEEVHPQNRLQLAHMLQSRAGILPRGASVCWVVAIALVPV